MTPISGHVYRHEGRRGSVWRAKYRLPDGRQVHRTIGPAWTERGRPRAGWYTKRTAEAWLRDVIEQAHAGALPGMVRTGVTFADAASEFLRHVEHDLGRKPSTVADYRSVLRAHLLPAFGALRLEDVTAERIESWKATLRLSNRTKIKLLTVLSGVLARARRVHKLRYNPMAEVEKPRHRTSAAIDVFSPEEVWALVRAAESDQEGAIYLTAAFTGLRRGELVGLRWRDVDFAPQRVRVCGSYAGGRLTTPKSGKVRSVPLAPDVRARWRGWRSASTGPATTTWCSQAPPARSGARASALAFFPDGRRLATGGANGLVTLWDVQARAVVRTLRFPDPVWRVAVSPDGRRLAMQTQAHGSPDSRVQVQELGSGRVLFSRPVRYGHGGLDFSPDGHSLAALGCCEPGSTIKVWDTRSGKDVFSPRVAGHATAIAFSADGRLGAGTEDGKLLRWDVRDGEQVAPPIQIASGPLGPISFSPDGRLLAASSLDGTQTLWDLRARRRLGKSFPARQGVVPTAGHFAPDGDLVIDYFGDAAKWPTDPRKWQRYACQVAGRELTRAEWSDVLPDRDYRRICSP